MRLIKIKRRPIRILVSIFTFLLMAIAATAVIYGIGLVSPVTKSLVFAMLFGAPDIFSTIAGGIITMVPLGLLGLIFWGLYKAVKTIYKSYS